MGNGSASRSARPGERRPGSASRSPATRSYASLALCRNPSDCSPRPAAQRASEGEVPGALVVERNVLEWRFDPASDARLPEATGYDVEVIVLCSEGYTSSLAADALRSLGLQRATDVVGGFRAWAAAGLPTRP